MSFMRRKTDKTISYIGEFTDWNLENEYFKHEISHTLKYIRPIVMVLGVLYFLFIIPDYFVIENADIFKLILLNRLVFVILVSILYIKLKYIKSNLHYGYYITAYEIIASLSFLLIFYQYESPNFLIQSFGIMILLLGIFLIPNRWVNVIFVSVLVSTAFFIISLHTVNTLKTSEFLAAATYIIIVVILSSISSLRTNYYKRVQYINEKELLKLSITDSLTGIYNRYKFEDELGKWINYSKRYKTDVSLIIFDFDNFKMINDNFGHLTGDRVLIETAQHISKSIRNTDLFARWGGEEFVILLPGTAKKQAVELTQRLKDKISNHDFNIAVKVTCSFGVTSLCNLDDITTIIQRADKLLYMAKDAGKNTIMS